MLVYRLRRRFAGYLVGAVAPSIATGLMVALTRQVAIPNISLLYLPAILLTAVYFGIGPSLVAATLAAAEYDFFLLRPFFTLTIGPVEDVLAFAIFVIVAVLTSQLAASARARAEAAQRRATENSMLYELGQALMSTHDIQKVLQVITERTVDVFGVDRCAIFVPDSAGSLSLAAETVQGPSLPLLARSPSPGDRHDPSRSGPRDRTSGAAAARSFQQGARVGPPSDQTAETHQRVYVPLRTADQVVGVMEIGPKRSGEGLDPDEHRLVTSFAAQAALAIARAESEEERHRLELLEESDRLKSALLSAVSHDLRTPLASIKASATTLLLADAAWTADDGRELLHTIDQEADRLNRLVGNLLDLSRIEAGVLRPVLDWYDAREMIDAVLPRLRPLAAGRPFAVEVQPDIPPVRIDLLRIEELIYNLVENAVKYTPPGTPIELRVCSPDGGLRLEVVDHGPGVPEGQRERVFDTFYRGRRHSDRNPGTGLGLAICKGVAEAHGGTLHVEPTPGDAGGATFVLTLPPSHLEREHLA